VWGASPGGGEDLPESMCGETLGGYIWGVPPGTSGRAGQKKGD